MICYSNTPGTRVPRVGIPTLGRSPKTHLCLCIPGYGYPGVPRYGWSVSDQSGYTRHLALGPVPGYPGRNSYPGQVGVCHLQLYPGTVSVT
eukprot:885248-Rhodomonas_salina.1